MTENIMEVPSFYMKELENYTLYLKKVLKKIYKEYNNKDGKDMLEELFDGFINYSECFIEVKDIFYKYDNFLSREVLEYVSIILSFSIYKNCLKKKNIDYSKTLKDIFNYNKHKINSLLNKTEIFLIDDIISYTNNLYILNELINKLDKKDKWIDFNYKDYEYKIENNILGDFINLYNYCYNILDNILEENEGGIYNYFKGMEEKKEIQQKPLFGLDIKFIIYEKNSSTNNNDRLLDFNKYKEITKKEDNIIEDKIINNAGPLTNISNDNVNKQNNNSFKEEIEKQKKIHENEIHILKEENMKVVNELKKKLDNITKIDSNSDIKNNKDKDKKKINEKSSTFKNIYTLDFAIKKFNNEINNKNIIEDNNLNKLICDVYKNNFDKIYLFNNFYDYIDNENKEYKITINNVFNLNTVNKEKKMRLKIKYCYNFINSIKHLNINRTTFTPSYFLKMKSSDFNDFMKYIKDIKQ
jgi:hypothetical protein